MGERAEGILRDEVLMALLMDWWMHDDWEPDSGPTGVLLDMSSLVRKLAAGGYEIVKVHQ